MKVVWTERAVADLLAIGDYIAQDNPRRAREFVGKLVKRVRQASRFPESGRIVPELADKRIRELIEGNYRIVYRLHGKAVVIVQIFECHRQFPDDI